jgi:propane monooxygenase reductase subunit
MSEKKSHTVRFEPVGVEMEVEEGEWVLDAAFRQGIAVPHGCREGRCSSCKCVLLEGDAEVEDYSTFALPDYERDNGQILLCRSRAFSDLTVELLNFDEDLMRRAIAVKDFGGVLSAVTQLTHDMRLLEVQLDKPLKFWAGQFVELGVPSAGVTRSYSMASTPDSATTLRFIIRKYPDGAFSSLLDTTLTPGTAITVKGPFGSCLRREGRPGPMLLVGGGSGMSPLWSILQDHIASGEQRPVRFFYGARTRRDLFLLEEFAAIAKTLPDFQFIPVLSQAGPDDAWTGETGFVHEAVQRIVLQQRLQQQLGGELDAYTCGPPPMVDAVLPVLQALGVALDHTYVDKFTPASASTPNLVH